MPCLKQKGKLHDAPAAKIEYNRDSDDRRRRRTDGGRRTADIVVVVARRPSPIVRRRRPFLAICQKSAQNDVCEQ